MAMEENSDVKSKEKKDLLSKQSREILHIKANILENEMERKRQFLNDRFLAEKERLQERCREISQDLYQLRLEKTRALENAKQAEEVEKIMQRKKKSRRKKLQIISREEREKRRQEEIKKRVQERLPKSIRKYVNRMIRHRRQTYDITSPTLSSSSSSSSEESGDEEFGFRRTPFMGKNVSKLRLKHRQISPVPANMLKIPKSYERQPRLPTKDVNDKTHVVFGTSRQPVYRQFPNNNWQRQDRWYSLSERTVTYDLEPGIHISTSRRKEDSQRIYNIYNEKLTIESRKSVKQPICNPPLGWPLGRQSVNQLQEGEGPVKIRQRSAPVSGIKNKVHPQVVATSNSSSDESFPDDASYGSDYQVELSTMLTLPRITVTTPAIRGSRTSADNPYRRQSYRKKALLPPRILKNPPNTPDILPNYALHECRYLRITPLSNSNDELKIC
ncbi:uncharacterized protein [Ptychodera flava]|uniref:uncharacterized protein n=1 Tax=Ptychodera flava TaxID=63121 RepID=UPI003969CEE0